METVGSARLDANHTTPIPATIGHRPKNRMLAVEFAGQPKQKQGCQRPPNPEADTAYPVALDWQSHHPDE
ncbi:hypothetical protein [Caballeronia choica]|jgi:hypothetical protein|uniref:hypothetical protein n=1 Tax=Caballeronia choica TaxID=326476 RepID=UPI000A47DF9E